MLVDDAVLAVLDLRIFQPRVFRVNPFGLRIHEAFPHVGRVQQSFGGDTSDQETRASQLDLFFDERCFQPVLSGANSSGVAAGTTSNHNEIVWHYDFILNARSQESEISTQKARSRGAIRACKNCIECASTAALQLP